MTNTRYGAKREKYSPALALGWSGWERSSSLKSKKGDESEGLISPKGVFSFRQHVNCKRWKKLVKSVSRLSMEVLSRLLDPGWSLGLWLIKTWLTTKSSLKLRKPGVFVHGSFPTVGVVVTQWLRVSRLHLSWGINKGFLKKMLLQFGHCSVDDKN